MHLVYKYIRIYRIQIRSDFTIVFLYLQRESIDNTGYQIICIHLFHLQRRFLLFEHRHLQHLFHLETQTFGLIIITPDICWNIAGDFPTAGSFNIWAANDMVEIGVLNSCVILFMKSFFISVNFF